MALSSSSNRARHERNQHKGEEMSDVLLVQQLPKSATSMHISAHVRSMIHHRMQPHDRGLNSGVSSIETAAADADMEPCASLTPESVEDSAQSPAATIQPMDPSAMELDHHSESNSEHHTAQPEAASHKAKASCDTATAAASSTSSLAIAIAQAHVTAADSEVLRSMVRPLMQEQDVQAGFSSFMAWLTQPSITSVEALVKTRRITSNTQMQPIQLNLRFMFGLLYERELVDAATIAPEALVKISHCRALYEALVERQAGSSRIHVLFLLVKKVLVFISSQDSVKRGVFMLPSSLESYMYVESICAEHGARRKQETRNRALLGAAASSQLQRQLQASTPRHISPTAAHAASSIIIPAAAANQHVFTQPRPAAGAQRLHTIMEDANKASSESAISATAAAATSHVVADLDDESDASNMNSLSKEDLRKVSQGCLAYLKSAVDRDASGLASERDSAADGLFVSYLVTAILCFGMAPRSQVLKQLKIGGSLVKNAADGKYWVRMLAEQSKNGKPTSFALPLQMTSSFDHYLTHVRPRMLTRLERTPEHDHGFVFFKRNGDAPRNNFSSYTNVATLRILSHPVNAHAFRAAVITAYYETGASQTQMNTLADIMAHDPETARNFYYRPQFARASVETNNAMVNFLL